MSEAKRGADEAGLESPWEALNKRLDLTGVQPGEIVEWRGGLGFTFWKDRRYHIRYAAPWGPVTETLHGGIRSARRTLKQRLEELASPSPPVAPPSVRADGSSTSTPMRSALLRKRSRHADGVIYFIQEGEDGPVKIGWTSMSPEQRLYSMQTGNPRDLRVIAWAPGSQDYEKKFHEQLGFARIRGEWFHPHPAVLFAAKELNGVAENAIARAISSVCMTEVPNA